MILLTERSTLYKDLLYGFDLLCHRVIKVNGRYCITPDFFRSAYWGGRLDGTIVYSETCEFYGMDGSVDLAMADALLAGGAEAVVGFVNNVYARLCPQHALGYGQLYDRRRPCRHCGTALHGPLRHR